jgi:hypothetical protein
MKHLKHIKILNESDENFNIPDDGDNKIIEIDSVYEFDKTYLLVEKESDDKVRLTIKSGYKGGEELDIVVNINKLKDIL